MAKLWGSRFKEANDELLERFNSSLNVDKRLWREDIRGSREHAKMLYSIGILEVNELDSILEGLKQIAAEIEAGTFSFEEHEDIHSAIEAALCQKIGQVGKKLHTARSRNDQVALDFTLYCRKGNLDLQEGLAALIQTLLDLAKPHTKTLMPGLTHLQHAQPISFGYHLVAWCLGFKRDLQRLRDNYKRSDTCPLGSAALAGTPYHNERENLARSLGFETPSLNAMDSVAQRDFALDLLYDIAMIMMHVSRVCEELVLWSSYEFGFVQFSDSFATGSSIMPQKKNPDVAELLRGKCGRTYGNLISLLTTMKGLAFAYNKDLQEDKEAVFDSLDTAKISLEILNASLKELEVRPKRMRELCGVGHMVATDLADLLVQDFGLPFREAHHLTGLCVRAAEDRGLDLSEMDTEALEGLLAKHVGGQALDRERLGPALSLEECLQRRNSLGGCNSDEVNKQIHALETWLRSLDSAF